MMTPNLTEGSPRRVAVTGMGLVSSVGLTMESLWNACSTGKSGIRSCTIPGTGFGKLRFAGNAEEFTGHISNFGPLEDSRLKAIRKGLKLMSREIQMGVASAQRALNDAKYESTTVPRERIGVSFASDYIITTPEEVLDGIRVCREGDQLNFSRWAGEGLPKMTPIWQLKFLTNMAASHIAIYNECYGYANAINGREASIGMAVGEAVEILKSGKLDMMIVGATGSRLLPFNLIHSLQMDEIASQDSVPEKACRPFDRDRTGSVPGEGAGALILEDLDHALQRGAPIYAEIVGGSYRGATRFHRGDPSKCLVEGDNEKAIELTLKTLLKKTGISPEAVGHLNVSGFGGRISDAQEARAIHSVFGKRAQPLPVTTLKGHIGNPGAGGGVIELIAGILALKQNQLFPILNNENDDPECPIHPVRELGVPSGDSFVKLAWQTTGQASAVLVRRFQ